VPWATTRWKPSRCTALAAGRPRSSSMMSIAASGQPHWRARAWSASGTRRLA
jgi:hypothetical protein